MGIFKRDPDGARTLLWVRDGSRTILAFVAAAKRRRRTIAVAAVVAVVAIAAGSYGFNYYSREQAAAAVRDDWSAVARCLVGEPLRPEDSASMRFRGAQLASLTHADLKRAPAKGAPWPDRCATVAHRLSESLSASGQADAEGKELAAAVAALAKGLEDKQAYAKDLSAELDTTWAAATALGLQAGAAPSVEEPPAPARPLSVDSMTTVPPLFNGPFNLSALSVEAPAEGVVHLGAALKELDAPMLCRFEATDAGACRALGGDAAKIPSGALRLLGTSEVGASPMLFAGERGEKGVFRSKDGKELAATHALGGYAGKDGFQALLSFDARTKRLSMLRVAGDRSLTQPVVAAQFRLQLQEPKVDAQMLWGHLVVRGTNVHDEVWMAGARVPPTGRLLDEVKPIGQLGDKGKGLSPPPRPKGNPRVSGCRTNAGVVARVDNGRDEYLSFYAEGQWSKPVRVSSAGGTLSCRRGEAAITRIDTGAAGSPLETAITHHRCNAATGCKPKTIKLSDLLAGEHALAPTSLLEATDLGGKLLVVWKAEQRGGVRMRLAPTDQVSKQADIVLFDDLVKDGKVLGVSTLRDMRLLSAGSFALLLLSTDTGVHALRIESNGKVTPVPVNRNKP
jgi:hypothetical protein